MRVRQPEDHITSQSRTDTLLVKQFIARTYVHIELTCTSKCIQKEYTILCILKCHRLN